MISVTAIAVAADFIGSLVHRPLFRHGERRLLFVAIAAGGFLLYLATFGVGRIDLYRAGFSPFAPMVLALAAAALARRMPRIACLAIAILAASDLQLLRSRNLLDYLFDPLVVGVAIFWCLVTAARWRPVTMRHRVQAMVPGEQPVAAGADGDGRGPAAARL